MSELYIKVQPPASTEWQRPTEWLAMPAIEEKILYGLVLVFETGGNIMRVEAPNNRIEWDFENNGTTVTSNGSPQTYEYDYSSLGGAVSVYTEDGTNRNYKQVIFKAEQVASLTSETIWELFGNAFADIRVSFAGLRPRVLLNNNPYLRIIECTSQGATPTRCWNSLTNLNLEQFICTSPINFLGTQTNVNINYDLGEITGGVGFTSCRFKKIESTNCKMGNTKATEIGNITIPTSGVDRFNGSQFEVSGSIACATTNARRLFAQSTTKKLIFSSFAARPSNFNITSTTRPFLNCFFLEELILPGCETGFSILNSNMGATAIDALFTSLGTANGSQTITVTGNPGSGSCTPSIATDKGYTVVVS